MDQDKAWRDVPITAGMLWDALRTEWTPWQVQQEIERAALAIAAERKREAHHRRPARRTDQ